MGLDRRIMGLVSDHRVGPVTTLARRLLDVAGDTSAVALVGLVVLALVVVSRRWQPAITVVVAVAGSYVLTEILKEVIRRPRPPYELAIAHPGGFSMPSTDAAITAAAAMAILVATDWSSSRRRHIATAILCLAVLAIGLCLVYLGVHWPSDVIAGWMVGVTVGTLLARVANKLPGFAAQKALGSSSR